MDRKEDLEATGERFRELIAGDPRASDEIRRGRAAFLEEVERRNAPAGFRSPVRAPPSPMVARSSPPRLVAAGAAALWILTRPADVSDR